MPLILERKYVLDLYAEAAEKGWVIPCFCTENLTTTEAVLTAAREYGKEIGQNNLPITIAITNLYSHRAQTTFYTHTRQWDVGLRLFLADLKALVDKNSPFSDLRVMVHLDHIQHDIDRALLNWDMAQFSSIMYEASSLPFEKNIELTKRFIEKEKSNIVVEGACDEIVDATSNEISELTTPERAERYINQTEADMIVANLGTEHRANAANLQYRGDKARAIKEKIGGKIVLHGCSSVPPNQIRNLFNDGIRKVNIWTTLERDSSPVLFRKMIENASKIIGEDLVNQLIANGLFREKCRRSDRASIDYFTTAYRQDIIFQVMKKIVRSYLELWYQ